MSNEDGFKVIEFVVLLVCVFVIVVSIVLLSYSMGYDRGQNDLSCGIESYEASQTLERTVYECSSV